MILVDTSQILVRDQGHSATGILILSSILRDHGQDADIISVLPDDNMDPRHIAERLCKRRPRFIAFNAICFNLPFVLRLAGECKRIDTGITTILGGIEATNNDRYIIENFDIDYILRGPAESSFADFIENIEDTRHIRGLTYRSKGKVYRNRNICRNDFSVSPDYDNDPYIDTRLPARVEVARGCPFSCTYCSTSRYWGKIIQKDYNVLKKEIMDLKFRGFRDFKLSGDSFPITKELINILSGCEITWGMSTRIEWVRDISVLKRAGCKYIYFGIESGSDRMQKILNKRINILEAEKNIYLVKKHEIQPKVSFIIGHPEETVDDLNDTLEMCSRLVRKGIEVHLFCMAPLSGTEVTREYKDRILMDKPSFISPLVGFEGEEDLILKHPDLFSGFYGFSSSVPVDLLNQLQESYTLMAKVDDFTQLIKRGYEPLEIFRSYITWEKIRGISTQTISELEEEFYGFMKTYDS